MEHFGRLPVRIGSQLEDWQRSPAFKYPILPNHLFVVIVPQNTQVDDYLGSVFVVVLAIIIALIILIMMVFFAVYRRTNVVRRANLWFIESTLFGCLLVDVGLILWSIYLTKLVCTLKGVLTMVGCGIVVGYRNFGLIV